MFSNYYLQFPESYGSTSKGRGMVVTGEVW